MSDPGQARVEAWRREARALHGAVLARQRAAAARCLQLPRFSRSSIDDLLAAPRAVTRRDAHDVVALEAGFAGWAHLLADCLPELARVTMYVPSMSASLNRWFLGHAEAAVSRATEGGVLLPYRAQFVVVALADVRELGLDAKDPDWERIAWDWVRPRDPEARFRLARARWHVMLARGEELP